jgi:hypothetical protein
LCHHTPDRSTLNSIEINSTARFNNAGLRNGFLKHTTTNIGNSNLLLIDFEFIPTVCEYELIAHKHGEQRNTAIGSNAL